MKILTTESAISSIPNEGWLVVQKFIVSQELNFLWPLADSWNSKHFAQPLPLNYCWHVIFDASAGWLEAALHCSNRKLMQNIHSEILKFKKILWFDIYGETKFFLHLLSQFECKLQVLRQKKKTQPKKHEVVKYWWNIYYRLKKQGILN